MNKPIVRFDPYTLYAIPESSFPDWRLQNPRLLKAEGLSGGFSDEGAPPVFQGAGCLARLRRPIVQCRGIEIRAVGPYQRVNPAIQPCLFKQA